MESQCTKIPEGIIRGKKPANIKTFVDMTNQVFGNLTVSEYYGKKKMRSYWLCTCACGNKKVVSRTSLVDGLTTSCGCAQKKAVTIHGMSKTPEYKAWRALIDRCENKRAASYDYYGGRGISVCRRWRESFACFFEDMGLRPSSNHSMDRINPDGNYEPSNCRWATHHQQNTNKRDNVRLFIGGEEITVSEAARKYSLPRHIVSWRFRQGWSSQEIISTPIRPRGKGAMRVEVKA